MKNIAKALGFLTVVLCPQLCLAVGSAELYKSTPYGYGRFEARLRFAPGDGIVSSFFLWKDGSEQAGAFWNELDFEKVGATCAIQSNPIYGNPSANHVQKHTLTADLCGTYHTYAYEWTPDYIAWLVDGAEIRHETGAIPQAYAQNASAGMQFHFNVWPGDASFGGNFNPSILPVHEYIDWVQYSAYNAGTFTLSWREDFAGATLPEGWLAGDWASPKNVSTHSPQNVNFLQGFAVLSITADNALGPAGAMPGGSGGTNGAAGSGSSGALGASGSPGTSGSPATGGNLGVAGTQAAAGNTGASGGAPGAGGSHDPPVGGSLGASGATNSTSGTGPSNVAGAPGTAGSMSPAASTESGSSCSFSPATSTGRVWWAMGIAAMALLHRRGRRVHVS